MPPISSPTDWQEAFDALTALDWEAASPQPEDAVAT
jgi:hypothetical protein